MFSPAVTWKYPLSTVFAGLLLAGAFVVGGVRAETVSPDNEVSWLTRLAADGDAGAELQLGLAYRDGRYGLDPDPRSALHWLTVAAHNGNAYAADTVGNLYAAGEGAPRDLEQAVYWWRIAARGGNANAQERLGEALLAEGQDDRALTWLRDAADRGDPQARADLALLYRQHLATDADLRRGLDPAAALSERLHFPGLETTFVLWDALVADMPEMQSSDALLARARQGDPVAEYQLAVRYRDGAWAVPRDPQQSRYWLERAASAGNPIALKTLARTDTSE